MAKKDPRSGELVTANYGWVKPTVGASTDAWGGYINADLDGIDSVVHGVQTSMPVASTSSPAMNGTASAGSSAAWSCGDHVHPHDTTKYDAANPAGYITAAAIPAPYILPPASTTILGGVKSDGTTIKAAGDGTISTTVVPMGDNRLINGDMRIDQRHGGASGTANGYTVDRWKYSGSQASKGTWQRATLGAGGLAAGLDYALQFTSSSAYTPLAADQFLFLQFIEADAIGDLAWGTANAQPVTLSFWAQSSLTGTFGGAITNAASTRCYPFTFNISQANAWTKCAVTIPGDTAGTWVLQGNAAGLSLNFDLGTGSTYRAPANAWTSTNFVSGANGTVSVVGTNGALFYVTCVKLEIGGVATPYNRQSLAKSMADCQRYYQLGTSFQVQANMTAGYGIQFPFSFPTTMRATPSLVGASFTDLSNCTPATTPFFLGADNRTIVGSMNVTATGQAYATMNIGALSAEL